MNLCPNNLKILNFSKVFFRKNRDRECKLYQVVQRHSPSEFLQKRRRKSSVFSGFLGISKKIFPYLLVPFLVVALFGAMFQIWKIDFDIPILSYNNDGLFSIFIIKSVIDTGWYLSNERVGLPYLTDIFRFYDFPMQSDLFHILVVKFFTYFSSNPFRVANCFYIASFAMVSATSFIALRALKISVFVSSGVSILYAFLPYHFVRGTWHLFLSNYMVVPLSVMVSMWIASDKISVFSVNKKEQYCVSANKFFFISLAIAAFAAINNIYYAYYSCVIFLFAWLLRGLKMGTFFDRNSWAALILCAATLFILACLFMPTFFYQMAHGTNSQVAGRSTRDSEIFGLKIIDLLLPVNNHYINYFSNLRNNFNDIIGAGPERASESLGIIGSVGFMFLLLWLIGRNFAGENSFVQRTIKRFSFGKNDQNLVSDLAGLSVLSVLFATVGGLVMFTAIPFPLLRSHARFCVFIAFISLFLVAIIFDKIIEKKLFGKKLFAQIAVGFVMVMALFDQAGRVSAATAQGQGLKDKFNSDRNFIELIEKTLPQKSMVFVLPAHGFPEQPEDDYRSVIAYAHSKNLRWSYPAIVGRESDLWQKRVKNLEFKEFISELKKAGFVGVYIDRDQYCDNFSVKKLLKLESDLSVISKAPKLISQNKKLEFFEI